MSLWEDTVLSPGRSRFGLNSTLYLHKQSNIPVAASALREPQLMAAAPWAVPGVGISEGQESQRVNPSASRLCPAVKGTFCQNKVWEAVLSFSWWEAAPWGNMELPVLDEAKFTQTLTGGHTQRLLGQWEGSCWFWWALCCLPSLMLHGMKCPFSALVLLRLGECGAFC